MILPGVEAKLSWAPPGPIVSMSFGELFAGGLVIRQSHHRFRTRLDCGPVRRALQTTGNSGRANTRKTRRRVFRRRGEAAMIASQRFGGNESRYSCVFTYFIRVARRQRQTCNTDKNRHSLTAATREGCHYNQ